VRFDTYIPCDALKPFVKALAISENADEKTYKVLPDTGLVLGFQYKGKLSRIQNQAPIPLHSSGITGLQDRYQLFKNTPDIGTILVFFKEAAGPAFFKQPIHELFRESISLDHFLLRSELLILEEQIGGAGTDSKRIELVEQFLISRIRPSVKDDLVLAALSLIHKSKGNIRIKELMIQLNTSQSPLEKRFRSVVGTTPKKFASIIRFKHTIQRYKPQNSLTDLGYEGGFYDQAHFIKEFKNFTGESPETFFQGR
jgi:AraC-like DNA-binding protein